MQKFSVSMINDLDLDWVRKDYRKSGDARLFGYDTAEFLNEKNLNSKGGSLSFVKVKPGLWLPEHYHRIMDEFFMMIGGNGDYYWRMDRGDIKTKSPVSKETPPFRIPPGELHSLHNIGDFDLYLLRLAFNKKPGDHIYTE
jgi:mannose-6-phosphate isomerase-like protein (cupin superfamily)